MQRMLVVSAGEFIIGVALIYFFDLRVFLLYFLAIYLIRSHSTTNLLRKILRVYHMSDASELRAILNKLDVSEDEVKRIMKERQSHLYHDERQSLERDIKDVAV